MKFHTADVCISFVTAIAMTDGLSKCIKKPFSLACCYQSYRCCQSNRGVNKLQTLMTTSIYLWRFPYGVLWNDTCWTLLFAAALSDSTPRPSGRGHVGGGLFRWSARSVWTDEGWKERRGRRCGGNGGRGLAITGREMAVAVGGRHCPEVILSDAIN